MGKKSGTKAAHYWLMNPAYAEMSNKKLLEDFKRKKKHVLADTNVPEYLENLVNRPMDVAQLIPVIDDQVPSVRALVPAEPAVNSITATQESQISSTTQVSGAYFIAKTSKSVLETLILESVNPQYDDRLFIELQVQYEKNTSSVYENSKLRTCCVHKLF